MNRDELQRAISAKAWEDEAFRKKLLKSPKHTIEETFDVQFAGDIRIHEDFPDLIHFILPMNPSRLTDEELDSITGGFDLYG